MMYQIHLMNRHGEIIWFEDSILDFWPKEIIEMLEANFVDDNMGICKNCEMDCHCHVLVPVEGKEGTYSKLCTVLFHDLVKPKWKLENVV